jgi:hypothetical protein
MPIDRSKSKKDQIEKLFLEEISPQKNTKKIQDLTELPYKMNPNETLVYKMKDKSKTINYSTILRKSSKDKDIADRLNIETKVQLIFNDLEKASNLNSNYDE